MKCLDEKWRLVAFISKSLSDIERNYEIYDKEILVVVRCLEVWRHFLEETGVKFEIWTDHKNLEYFMKVQKLNRRQARWALYLLRFDFTLKHVLGSKMGKADNLSRRPDWEVGVEKDNENETLVKPEWLEVRKTDVRLANSKAGIKPTALLLAFDKENSIEFPFDFLYYIYNHYCDYALYLPQSSCYPSCDYPVTHCDCGCDHSVTNVTPL